MVSLHKYLDGNGNPVKYRDPTGDYSSLASIRGNITIQYILIGIVMGGAFYAGFNSSIKN